MSHGSLNKHHVTALHMENTVLAIGVAIRVGSMKSMSLATQPPFPTTDVCTAASNKF